MWKSRTPLIALNSESPLNQTPINIPRACGAQVRPLTPNCRLLPRTEALRGPCQLHECEAGSRSWDLRAGVRLLVWRGFGTYAMFWNLRHVLAGDAVSSVPALLGVKSIDLTLGRNLEGGVIFQLRRNTYSVVKGALIRNKPNINAQYGLRLHFESMCFIMNDRNGQVGVNNNGTCSMIDHSLQGCSTRVVMMASESEFFVPVHFGKLRNWYPGEDRHRADRELRVQCLYNALGGSRLSGSRTELCHGLWIHQCRAML